MLSDALVETDASAGAMSHQQPEGAAYETELLRRAQRGDVAAFEALVDRLRMRVYGLARRIVGCAHDAEDVTQQTFLSVIEHIDQFRGEAAASTWVLRIAANHALKILRKRRGLPTLPLHSAADLDDGDAQSAPSELHRALA